MVGTLKCKLICMYKGSLICSACYACDKQQRPHTFVTQLDGEYLSEEKNSDWPGQHEMLEPKGEGNIYNLL